MSDIVLSLLTILWFLMPAGFANMVASISGRIFPEFTAPLDFGLTFRGKRIFGEHKTIRGLLCGIIVGASIYFIQSYLAIANPNLQSIEIDNYRSSPLLGILFPLGALMGDALKSFFKRQLAIRPGKTWFPFDQTDWLIGTLFVTYCILKFSVSFAVSIILIGILLHILIKLVGFLFHLQDEKF